MDRINGNPNKQTLFDAMTVLAKAEKNDNGRVIYESGRIRNYNLADKIKTGISNFFGNKKLNELKSSIAKESARLLVENKIKENLLIKTAEEIQNKISANSIGHANLPRSISSNFLENAMSFIKSEKILEFKNSPNEKIKKTSNFDTTLINETNINIDFLENLVKEKLAHLPALVKAATTDPTIEKFINIILETKESPAGTDKAVSGIRDPAVLIEMAKQARHIKSALGCNSKKAALIATRLIRTTEVNQDTDKLISTLKRRTINFILAKQKFDINSVEAIGYALLMDHFAINDRLPSADKKEALNLVDKTFSKITRENKAEFLDDPGKFLNQTIGEHLHSQKIKKYEIYIKNNEFIILPSTRKKYAEEMANKAYAALDDEQKLEAAKIYFHNLPKLNENPGKHLSREGIAKRAVQNVPVQQKSTRESQSDDGDAPYDPRKDPNFYEQF